MGYLSDYFTIENVTYEITALAYVSAFGWLIIFETFNLLYFSRCSCMCCDKSTKPRPCILPWV